MTIIDRRVLVKVALAAAALAVLTSRGVGQERPKFEVATVKPAAPNATPRNQIVPTSPNRLYIPSMSLSWLIYTAYGDGGFNTSMRVTGGPAWVNTTPWAVEAVAPGISTLSLPQSRPLVGDITTDRTGLTGRYTLELKYDFTPRRPADPNAPPEVAGQPSLATAVKEQWGLRFERGLGPFRLVTVESAQEPAAN